MRWQVHFGFGDLQYLNYLDRISGVFENFSALALKQNYTDVEINRAYYLGGALASDWCWNKLTQQIEPV